MKIAQIILSSWVVLQQGVAEPFMSFAFWKIKESSVAFVGTIPLLNEDFFIDNAEDGFR